jgi:CheY-like chemotaxis protein
MRILIVDDEPVGVLVIKRCLERAGHQTEYANDGAAALEKIRERAPDLLITDIQMPVMCGEKLCRAIQSEFPDRRFPIIVITGTIERGMRQWIATIPGAEFLEKPFSPRQIVERVGAHATTMTS